MTTTKLPVYTVVVVFNDTLRGPTVVTHTDAERARFAVGAWRARPDVLSATMHLTTVSV